jgi:superfamily II DNA or RNA helicase
VSTPYHARYFAHELTRQSASDGVDRLSNSLFDATVDLNPHQIDAALFALQSPLGKGVVLADEVGLGKTIEAGLILCQHWAERKRRLLVICPASLRKQWSLELAEKFNLPTVVLDAATYRRAQREGDPLPFLSDGVVIVSYNYASRMQAEVRAVGWDLVVIDEAHKLRNAYRPSNRTGQRLRWALEDRRKVLLTATPLQNSLLELYGLSTVIDEHLFGDAAAFRSRYMRQDSDLGELRRRLASFCKRTLRRQVTEYVQYTERRAITRPFRPTDDEHRLYEAVSAFLQRPHSYAIPNRQRALTTLILRKLLASSSHAIAGTFQVMRERLEKLQDGDADGDAFVEQLVLSEELEDDYLDEAEPDIEIDGTDGNEPGSVIDPERLAAEIAELDRYAMWARDIGVDTKSRTLLAALEIGFAEMEKMTANRKALIFTESRRTQEYLRQFLEANGYAGKVVLFNGSNADPESRAIFEQWVRKNDSTGRISGSRPIDMRTAVVEHFRDGAEIMIATEAAAEGVNLQFCSLVINYDLPWNPQRVEQRIGRCHRYGQRHDVVVVNFLNERNEADRRVLELLTEKFNLFSGIFGASDEVLGTLESGVDFEKRILEIYEQCRTPPEIEAAFQALRSEMDDSISLRMDDTRRALMEHFDEDVHDRLRVQLDNARARLDHMGRLFWSLSRFVLGDRAAFDDQELAFDLHTPPLPELPRGRYHLISKTQANLPGAFLYRLSHPLGEHVLARGKSAATPAAEVTFDITGHPTRIAAIEALNGRSGWLTLQQLTIDSFEREEHLLFSAFDDAGRPLDQETCEKLFRCSGAVRSLNGGPVLPEQQLGREAERHVNATVAHALERGNALFNSERERLERWADDMVLGAEKELADTKAQIKALNRQARLATTTEEQHSTQTKLKELEREQRRQRQRIFDLEDEIADKRDELIADLEKRLHQKTHREPLFTIRWTVQ